MIRQYKFSQIGKYKAIFEMVVDDNDRQGIKLPHMRELIFLFDHQRFHLAHVLQHFYEIYKNLRL